MSKKSEQKSNALVAFTCNFYVSDDVYDDVVYGGVINNRHGPNKQHLKLM